MFKGTSRSPDFGLQSSFRRIAIRIRFKTLNVGLDELEVFGTGDRRENLAHKRRGTKVSGFPEKTEMLLNKTKEPVIKSVPDLLTKAGHKFQDH